MSAYLKRKHRREKKLRARTRDKAQAIAVPAFLRDRPDLDALFAPIVPPPPIDPKERVGVVMGILAKKVGA